MSDAKLVADALRETDLNCNPTCTLAADIIDRRLAEREARGREHAETTATRIAPGSAGSHPAPSSPFSSVLPVACPSCGAVDNEPRFGGKQCQDIWHLPPRKPKAPSPSLDRARQVYLDNQVGYPDEMRTAARSYVAALEILEAGEVKK